MRKIEISGGKVTPADIEKAVVDERYYKLGTKMTACVFTLVNGHEVVGLSGVVDANSYDMTIGGPIARDKAVDEVWSILGAILQNELADVKK